MESHPGQTLPPSAMGGDWFRVLFERSADAMTLIDPETGRFIDCNDASAEAIGAKDRLEALGLSPPSLAPEYQSDGQLSTEAVVDHTRLTLEKGSHRFDWLMKRLDGIITRVDIVATVLEADGRKVILTTTRNVERSKRIEEDLRVSESRWTRVFEQAPISIQIFAPDGASRRVNAAFRRLFEPVVPDLSEFNILQDPQLAAAGLRGHIERAFAGEVVSIPSIPFEMRVGEGRASKGLRWIGSTMFPVVDPDTGQLVEVVCVHEDDTARKQAEIAIQELNQSLESKFAERTTELRESEKRFKALFEHSPVGMARVDWEGNFLQVNSSFAQVVGYTREEVERMSYWDITPPEYNNDESAILESVKVNGHFGPFEKEYVHRDGHRVQITISGMLIEREGGQYELWGITQDISIRKRAEEALRSSEKKFRTLFEESRQGVMLHDEHTFFSEVNPAAAAMFGQEPSFFIGRHPSELAPEYQPNGELSEVVAKREIAKCLATGTARFDWTHRHADGRDIWIEVVLSRIPQGDKNYMQAVVIDMSERKRAEEELKRSLERERELSQLKSNFVSMVSHEFRTPLGIIQSSAEILDDYLDQLDPAERREQLVSIIKNSRRMAGLMEDVLLLGRLDSGRMEFVPRPLDLGALCRRMVDEVRSTTDARCPIDFSTRALPPEALADESLLRHILLNLLSNAVKYSPDGATVTFRAACEDGALVFHVRDRGIGIPEQDLPGLFEAFRRGSNVGQTPGTGLGLVIVRQSVELHRGTISVESSENGGTTFTVQIPFSPA
ncbi:PAS domain S-box protein [Luteolibacter flavescens]|uniref:histidine kinase n=1 Tax=Luteolibacter flavescens TaxID=1859460 RepID=A0ABT3FW34_9BACT|nr:PAS domain S-box protein [Luteolibacter flavescens]MCW1887768.1 PAS domain S-box protein [Luteolibacter flavescens]